MPKFAILISKDDYGWWTYSLVIDHRPIVNPEHYATPQVAFTAALFEANRRGYYNA